MTTLNLINEVIERNYTMKMKDLIPHLVGMFLKFDYRIVSSETNVTVMFHESDNLVEVAWRFSSESWKRIHADLRELLPNTAINKLDSFFITK